MVADVPRVAPGHRRTGLIAADSSIWEVHWDGQQEHFAYTTITAANGLCSAARLASAAGDATDVTAYNAAGAAARDAILRSLRAPDGTIAQSLERSRLWEHLARRRRRSRRSRSVSSTRRGHDAGRP